MVRKAVLKISHPLVSVVMPVYNAEAYLIESIESILQQSFNNFEFLIIDDDSYDTSLVLIKKYAKKDKRIVVIRNKKNLKMALSLNKAIASAKGKYIARMDADDWSYPDRLLKQVRFLEENPDVGIVGGSMEIINENGKRIGKRDYPLTDASIRRKMFRYSPYSHPLIMVKKAIFDKVGYYDPMCNPAEDYDLYFRIGQVSQFANLNDVLLRYRVVGKSMTTGSTRAMEEKTIAIRSKYMSLTDYHATTFDKLYNQLHWLSLYLIPSGLKMYLFHYFRNT